MNTKDYEAMATALFDILFGNDELGEFELTLPSYMVESPSKMWRAVVAKMNVVFKHNAGTDGYRMPVIVVENNGKYQDFYYNKSDGFWKMLSESEDTMEDWWEEEQVSFESHIPEIFKNIHTVGKDITKGIDNIIAYTYDD